MRIHGATAGYVRQMKSLGYDRLSADDLVSMRIHGATPEFVKDLRELGYRDLSADDLVSMRIHGVTPEYIQDLQELGYKDVSAEDLVSMRIHGVTIDYVRKMKARLKNVSVDELVSMRIHGRGCSEPSGIGQARSRERANARPREPGSRLSFSHLVGRRLARFSPLQQAVDIIREDLAQKRRKKRLIIGAASAAGILLITLGLSRLKPAAPTVEKSTVWMDTVKRGPMLRQVRGPGTLVPQEIRFVSAATEGRVERLVILPGAPVKPDSILIEMSNPELEREALDAESQVLGARARARKRAGAFPARRHGPAGRGRHGALGLPPGAAPGRDQRGPLQGRPHRGPDGQAVAGAGRGAPTRNAIEEKRVATVADAAKAQIAVQEAKVDQLEALAAPEALAEGRPPRAGRHPRRSPGAARPGRPAGRPGLDPRQGRRADEAEGPAQDRGDAGQGHRDRAARIDRHAQRRGRGQGRPHRSRPCSTEPSPWTWRSKARCRRARGRTCPWTGSSSSTGSRTCSTSGAPPSARKEPGRPLPASAKTATRRCACRCVSGRARSTPWKSSRA